jgi:tetratricopeptide (TPR) repeat protein
LEKPFAAYDGDEPYIFVCYAHDDAELVYPEIARLHHAGYRIWYDEGISPGSEWSDSIAQHIQRCSVFLFFVTPRSVDREHCRREINFALDQHCALLPVHLEKTEVSPALQLSLSHRQAILRYEYRKDSYQQKLDLALRPEIDDRGKEPISANADNAGIRSHNNSRQRSVVALVAFSGLLAALYWLYDVAVPETLERTVVVHPFESVGSDPRTRTNTAGIETAVTDQLDAHPSLTLFSLTTNPKVLTNTSYSVKGSTQVSDEILRVTVSLIRRDGGVRVWSEKFDGDLSQGRLATQSRLAQAIARHVLGYVTLDIDCEAVRRKASRSEAGEYLCTAMKEELKFDLDGTADWVIIIDNVRKAIDLDPDLGLAHRMLANYYNNQADTQIRAGAELNLTRESATRLAREHAIRALELEPRESSSYVALGNVQLQLNLDYEKAQESFEKAISMDPQDPYAGWYYSQIARSYLYRGNLSMALENFERAVTLSGWLGQIYFNYARALLAAQDWERLIDVCEAGLLLTPDGLDGANLMAFKSIAHHSLDQTQEAVEAMDSAWNVIGHNLPELFAYYFSQVGRPREARQLVEKIDPESGTNSGLLYLAYYSIGDRDRAFEWLHKAIDDRNQFLLEYIRIENAEPFLGLRNDVRWSEVIQHLERVEA